jgi:hypothetical protein
MDGDRAARRVGGRQGKPGESLGVGEGSCDRKRKRKTAYLWGSWSYLRPFNLALRSVCCLVDISKRPLNYNIF